MDKSKKHYIAPCQECKTPHIRETYDDATLRKKLCPTCKDKINETKS